MQVLQIAQLLLLFLGLKLKESDEIRTQGNAREHYWIDFHSF
jgi:hypothetical protein